MASATRATKTTKRVATVRESDRPATVAAKTSARANKPAASNRVPAAAVAVSKPSKNELRAQVEKLETTVATLRAKNRDANRAAKTAAARIAELEDQVARLEKPERKVAPQASTPRSGSKTGAPGRGKRKSHDIDPGDAVPPGVAVQEPAPLDEEAETTLRNLEDHLESE